MPFVGQFKDFVSDVYAPTDANLYRDELEFVEDSLAAVRCKDKILEELDAVDDFEFIKLDTINSKDSDEYKDFVKNVHPHGTIPALVTDDGNVILESGAICMYLADHYNKLIPPAGKRQDYYNFCLYASVTLDEILEFLYWQWVVKPKTPDTDGVARLVAKSDTGMQYLTDTLKDRKWICGDEFTAADCILGYSLMGAGHEMYNKGVLLEKFPVVRKYLERLQERPSVQKTEVLQGTAAKTE